MVSPDSVQSVEIARAESRPRRGGAAAACDGTGADVLELRVNGVFVMDTLETTSEIELAAQALDLVEEPSAVLVGGLGLGFTLQRVLADPRVERAVVVEIEETLVAVDARRDGAARARPAGRHARHRRQRRHRDGDRRGALDLRPGAPRRRQRAGLPGARATTRRSTRRSSSRRCRDVLGPGGVLVVWSANAAPDLLAALRAVFGAAEEQAHDVLLQDRPEEYFLYLARR